MRKKILKLSCFTLVLLVVSCTKQIYLTNGETIYRKGKDKNGEALLDKSKSSMTFIKNCQGCHGKNGDRNSNCIIKWSHLSDPKSLSMPYNDSLFFRFIDNDLKSDGTEAQTGVHWNMPDQDKKDLIEFLKTL